MIHKIARVIKGEYTEVLVDDGPSHAICREDREREEIHKSFTRTHDDNWRASINDIDKMEGIASRGMKVA